MRVVFILLFCIFEAQLFAGQSKKDSLLIVLKTAKEDTGKVVVLTQLADALTMNDPVKSIAYAEQAIALATKLNYQNKLGLTYLVLAASTSSTGKNKDALGFLEKAIDLCDKANDSINKARAYSNMGWVYYCMGNFEESLKTQTYSLQLSKKNKNIRGIASSTNRIGLVYYKKGRYVEALKMQHLALEMRIGMNDSMNIAGAYNNIGIINSSTGKLTEALSNFSNAIKIQKQLNNNLGVALGYMNIGFVYKSQAEYTQALHFFNEGIKLFKLIGDVYSLSDAYNSIGSIYLAQGNYAGALKTHLMALKIAEGVADKSAIASSYERIGDFYVAQGNNTEALKNYLASLKLRKETGEQGGIAMAYDNIGALYLKMGQAELALENQLTALKIQIEINEQPALVSTYTHLGSIYEMLGNYSEALKNHTASLKIAHEQENKQGIAQAGINMGKIYLKLKKYREAQNYYTKSLLLTKEIGNKELTRDTYQALAELYKAKGDYAKAYEYFKLRIVYRDSLINEDNTKKTVQLQMQYDFDKKTAADSLRNVEQKRLKDTEIALRTADLQRSRMQFWFVVVGLFIVAVALVLVVNRFRITSQQKKIIEQQNEQIVESINYSKQIQDALLPDMDEMKKHFPGLLIHNLPRDIVSGDFYWFRQSGDYSLLACVDCTGHGVPGAFMSTLGSLLLDKIVSTGILNTAEILNRLNEEIIRILHQHVGGGIQDGMDLSVCLIDHRKKSIVYSGARNGVIVVRNGEAKRFKADLLPVGGNYMKNGKLLERNFKSHELPVQAGDWLYMYTDGFVEQTGGVSPGSPMNYQQFEQHLISVSTNEDQDIKADKLKKALDEWRGDNERTDDVLIIGIQV